MAEYFFRKLVNTWCGRNFDRDGRYSVERVGPWLATLNPEKTSGKIARPDFGSEPLTLERAMEVVAKDFRRVATFDYEVFHQVYAGPKDEMHYLEIFKLVTGTVPGRTTFNLPPTKVADLEFLVKK